MGAEVPSPENGPVAGPAAGAAARPATLTTRAMGIDTYRERVAYLRRDCPVVRAEGFQPLAKVQIRAAARTIVAVVNVVDDARLLGECELGLGAEALAELELGEGATVQIAHAEPAPSLAALRRKIAGARLSRADLTAIVRDIGARRYSKIELAAFVVATYRIEVDRDEVLDLTSAMVDVGRRLDWRRLDQTGPIVDKHCIGGIPGNRTSMLVVPIVAAYADRTGILIPKTSSRAITSPAGTADTMACLAQVELPFERLVEVVRRHRGCLAWGGRAQLSPADDVLISVSRPLSLDAAGQMVASILSKKIAAGSTHLVLDIPLGPTAKVRDEQAALRLKELFEYVASRLGLVIDAVITDGRQPIGRGIGPRLEARDVMQVLHNDPRGPADLREKALRLAGRVMAFDPVLRGDPRALARAILDSGRALAKMLAIIDAQGRHEFDWRSPVLGPLVHEVPAGVDGTVIAIDNEQLARIARLAGAPAAPGAGVDLLYKLGDEVRRGAPLYRVFAANGSELHFAREVARRASGFTIGARQKQTAPRGEF